MRAGPAGADDGGMDTYYGTARYELDLIELGARVAREIAFVRPDGTIRVHGEAS